MQDYCLSLNLTFTFSQVEVVVTTAIGAQIGKDVSGVRVVKITKDKLTHQFFPTPNIPEVVRFD